jgi:hypothetical protein
MTEVAEIILQITGVCAVVVIFGGAYSIRQLRKCSRTLDGLKCSRAR